MFKRSLGTRVMATAIVAAAFGVGGVATGTAAFAANDDPSPPSGSCVNRQVTEHNGYTFVCVNGVWKYWRFGSDVPTANQSQDDGPVKPVKGVKVERVPAGSVAPPKA